LALQVFDLGDDPDLEVLGELVVKLEPSVAQHEEHPEGRKCAVAHLVRAACDEGAEVIHQTLKLDGRGLTVESVGDHGSSPPNHVLVWYSARLPDC
jgi:hypothetical protein